MRNRTNHRGMLLRFALAILALSLLMGATRNMPLRSASADFAHVLLGDSVLIDVLANNQHLGANLSLVATSQGALGSTVIESGKVRYTPHPDANPGTDRFAYTVRLATGQLAFGAVQVEVQAGQRTLRLEGRIEGAQPSCSVTAFVGTRVFSGCLEADGRFSIDLLDASPNALVRLEASVVTPSGRIDRFVSYTRSVSQLTGLANEHAVLTDEDYSGLKLTPFTSAFAAVLYRANGFQHPDSLHRLAELNADVDALWVLTHGVVFHALTQGLIGLPPGSEDAWHAILSAEGATQLQQALGTQYAQIRQDLIEDPRHVAGFDPGLSGRYMALPTSAAGEPLVNSFVNFQWLFSPAGTGTLHTHNGVGGATIDWAVDASGLVLVEEANPPRFENNYVFVCSQGSQSIRLEREYRTTHMARLVETLGPDPVYVGGVSVVIDGQDVPPDCTHPSALLPSPLGYSLRLHALEDLERFSSPAALGPVALNLVSPAASPSSAPEAMRTAGVLDFRSGRAQAPGIEESFSHYELSDGRLLVVLTATPEAGGGTGVMEFARVRALANATEVWMATASTSRGLRTGIVSLAVGAGDVAFEDMYGLWLSGFRVSTQGSSSDLLSCTYWEVLPGEPGRGFYYENVVEGEPPNANPIGWSVADGELLLAFYHYGGATHPECPVVPPLYCSHAQKRTWTPVAMIQTNGRDRLYVREELWIEVLGGNEPFEVRYAPRINFYERRESVETGQPHMRAGGGARGR